MSSAKEEDVMDKVAPSFNNQVPVGCRDEKGCIETALYNAKEMQSKQSKKQQFQWLLALTYHFILELSLPH